MSLLILDPTVAATHAANIAEGTVPQFSTTDAEAAQAFCDYYNTLADAEVFTLETVTTYKLKYTAP